jgi:hypothetical protein
MANVYDDKEAEQRGRILRLLLNNPSLSSDDGGGGLNFNTTPWSDNGGGAFFGTNIKNDAGSIPTIGALNALNSRLVREYSFLLDGLTGKIGGYTTDLTIGNTFPTADLKSADGENVIKTRQNYGFGSNIDRDKIEVGLGKIEKSRQIKTSAIQKPDDYIKEVNADLKSIDDQAFIVYQNSFFKYHNQYQYPSDQAKNLAMSDMNTYKDILLQQHKAIYQKEDFTTASSKIIQNVK